MPGKTGKLIFAFVMLVAAVSVLEFASRKIFMLQMVKVTFTGDKIGADASFKLSDDPVLLYEWKELPQEFSSAKPAGVFRIFAVGDSVTYRRPYDISEFYPFILGQMLNRAPASGRHYEVINSGTPGYNLIQEARLLEKRIAGFSPDLVIIGYCAPNDRTIRRTLIRYRDGLYCSDIWESYPYVSILPQRTCEFLMRHSFLWRFVNFKLVETIRRSPGDFLKNKIGSFELSRDTEDALKSMQATAARNNFGLLLVVFPWLEEGGQEESDWIIARCKEYGLDYIDLRKSFGDFGYGRLKITADDSCHPNIHGHRLAAEDIFRYLNVKE